MGRAKKLKMLRRAIKEAHPDLPPRLFKSHFRKMKKIVLNNEINPKNGKK